MKISVVTVVYNSENTIEETLCSVINQSYKNIEYIVIDGGSTDGTIEEIVKNKQVIKLFISEPDQGIYDAMNKALKLASGDFLIFMNAGDTFFSNNAIEEFVKVITNKDAVYYGDAIYINRLTNKTNLRGGYFNKYRLAKTNICHQTIFYPKVVFKSYTYNLKYKLFADWANNMQLYKKHKFIYLNQTISYFDSGGISAIYRDLPFEKDQKNLITKYLGFDSILYLIYNKIKNSILHNHKNYNT